MLPNVAVVSGWRNKISDGEREREREEVQFTEYAQIQALYRTMDSDIDSD